MNLLAITKARAFAFLEIDELNVGGKIRLADCVPFIVGKYDFKVFPTKIEDFDLLNKGVLFESGRFGDLLIDTMKIYNRAIFIDTVSNTEDSKNILQEMLEWGKQDLGLTYSPDKITRWGYVSDLVFSTDFPLLAAFSSPLEKLAHKTSAFTDRVFGGLPYQANSVSVGHDPAIRKSGIASFTIQNRVDTRFGENRFFSEAPLPTDLHIQYLQEFEADVLESKR
ncbi:MAG: hypothetical protein WAM66_12110 [Acidobacteriaceae bacterium]